MSTISQSDRGTSSHRAPPGPGPGTATITHAEASQPLEKLQRPETRTPPRAGSALPPAGLMHVLDSVSGPPAKYSSWAAEGKWPSHQLCTIHSEQTHAVEPHARPSSQPTAWPASRSSPWPP